MNINKINSITNSNYQNSNIMKNPQFTADFAMQKNVLNYVIQEGLINGRNMGQVQGYWKQVLRTLSEHFSGKQPYNASLHLNATDGYGNAELLCFHPRMQGAIRKNVGDLKATDLVDTVKSTGDKMLEILRQHF